MSAPAAAVRHAGDSGPATGSPTVTAMVPGPTKIATGVAPSASKPRQHHVVRGDTPVSISRRYSCDTKVLDKANQPNDPRRTVEPGDMHESLITCISRRWHDQQKKNNKTAEYTY